MSDFEKAKKLFFQALDLIDSCNFEGAEARLRKALRLAPGHVNILTNLSGVLLQQNRPGEARACAEEALAAKPDNIEALLVLADCCARGGALAEALAAYDRVVSLDATIAAAHNNRGLVLEQLGRPAEALASYDRAIALAPQFSDPHVNRGNALDDPDQALAAYDQALTLNPDLAEAWLGRGNVFYNLGRWDDALAAYDRALALRPDLTLAWLGRGNVFCKLKRNDEGLAAYDQALARTDDLAEAWLGRGNALCDLKRPDEALAAHARALALKPDFAEAWFGRGNAFHELKRYEEALTAYDKALSLSAELDYVWLARADTLRLLKHAPESIAAYRQALKRGADSDLVRYHLAGLGAEPSPSAPPERFIVNLFDSYADNFERHLVDKLKYRMPILLADAIRRFVGSDALDILDLGCGTGLMGERLRPLKRTLTGVDLSPNMLEKARRRDIYDHLVASDLTKFLETQNKAFNLAVAADVFVYLGDLSQVFRGVRNALRDGGLFGFSVEASDDGEFVLRRTLRYAHSVDYLRNLAERYQFIVETIEPQVIRQDSGADIHGHLAIMRLPS